MRLKSLLPFHVSEASCYSYIFRNDSGIILTAPIINPSHAKCHRRKASVGNDCTCRDSQQRKYQNSIIYRKRSISGTRFKKAQHLPHVQKNFEVCFKTTKECQREHIPNEHVLICPRGWPWILELGVKIKWTYVTIQSDFYYASLICVQIIKQSFRVFVDIDSVS